MKARLLRCHDAILAHPFAKNLGHNHAAIGLLIVFEYCDNRPADGHGSAVERAGVKIGGVVGFPLGAATTSVKRYEALDAIRLGAQEVDMVMNIGALRSGDRARVEADIRGLVEIAHDNGAILKVTIETALLSLEEKILACQLALAAGADFVKSSTGFSHRGAIPADISLMRGVVGDKLGVKASGGIRTFEDAQSMIEAGANRIGTSSSVAIVQSAREKPA